MKQLALVFPDKLELSMSSEQTHVSQIQPLLALNSTGVTKLSRMQAHKVWNITDEILPSDCPHYRNGNMIFIGVLVLVTLFCREGLSATTESFCKTCGRCRKVFPASAAQKLLS